MVSYKNECFQAANATQYLLRATKYHWNFSFSRRNCFQVRLSWKHFSVVVTETKSRQTKTFCKLKDFLKNLANVFSIQELHLKIMDRVSTLKLTPDREANPGSSDACLFSYSSIPVLFQKHFGFIHFPRKNLANVQRLSTQSMELSIFHPSWANQ